MFDDRFVHLLANAFCDALGVESPAARQARRAASAVPSGNFELPAYVRRGIVIPGIAPWAMPAVQGDPRPAAAPVPAMPRRRCAG